MPEEESKWYEKLKNRCPKCLKYDAVRFKGEVADRYVFNCKFCDFVKSRRIETGSWEIKDGKTFVNGIESELKRNLKGELFIGGVKNSLF